MHEASYCLEVDDHNWGSESGAFGVLRDLANRVPGLTGIGQREAS